MELSGKDRQRLRDVAAQYAEMANPGAHREKIEMWKALNRGAMQRPMVLIDQIPWNEMDFDGQLAPQVEDPFFRQVETELRRGLYLHKHMPADKVPDPFVSIPKAITGSGYGLSSKAENIRKSESLSVASRAYTNQIQEPEDLEKITDMVFTHDEALSEERYQTACEVFNGILPVRMRGVQFHLGVWDSISTYMGVENAYIELMDRPEFMHALAQRMYQSLEHGIDMANRLGLHDDVNAVCHCSHIYTDELLPAPGQSKGPESKNCWAFGLAQLFTAVAPATTLEYELDYLRKLASKFGMLYYGCCERLDDRLESVLEIPNIRKVSCSPWSHKEAFAEKIGRRAVMSCKPNPAFLASDSVDYDLVRKDLAETVAVAKRHHVNLEFILKDLSTLLRQPQRLFRWAEIAMETVCSI